MEFDVLKELAKTVNKNKIKHIEVLGNSEKNKSKADIFFEGLISDKFVNEKDIVRFFFKTYDTKHPPYIKLKSMSGNF
jgi:hypothetical protein